LIEVQKLLKTFHDRKRGEVAAVKDVSFVCPPGKVFGLLGRNGAGKTTTLRMLATILVPTSGTAKVAGHDILQKPAEVRRSIGYLSGETKLYDRLTGRELLSYFGALASMSGSRLPRGRGLRGHSIETSHAASSQDVDGMKQRLDPRVVFTSASSHLR
jgi:sodium transport system ATP-binding protein